MRHLFIFLAAFLCLILSTSKVIAPSSNKQPAIPELSKLTLEKVFLLQCEEWVRTDQRKQILGASLSEINNLIDLFFEINKKDQSDLKLWIEKLIQVHFEIAESPLDILPSLTTLGFQVTPKYLQAFYGASVKIFKVTEKISRKRNIPDTMRSLSDWEIGTRLVQIPEIRWIFSNRDRGKIHKTSSFGNRKHPVYLFNKFHDGEDLVDTCAFHQRKTPLFTPFPGFQKKEIYDPGDGYSVSITDTTRTVVMQICHLEKKSMSYIVDGSVGARYCMGFIGTTGVSTGIHAHVKFLVYNIKFNPGIIYDWEKGIQKSHYVYVDKTRGIVLGVQEEYPTVFFRGM